MKDFDYFLIYDSWGNITVRSDLCVCLLSVCSPWIWIQISCWLFLGSSYMPRNSLHSCKSCSALQAPPTQSSSLTIALHAVISHPALYFKPPDWRPTPLSVDPTLPVWARRRASAHTHTQTWCQGNRPDVLWPSLKRCPDYWLEVWRRDLLNFPSFTGRLTCSSQVRYHLQLGWE